MRDDLVKIPVQADFVPALNEGGQKLRISLGYNAGHKETALDPEPIKKIEEAPDARAGAKEPLFVLSDERRSVGLAQVPQERGFRIHVDSETEGTLTVFGPHIGWPRRGAGGRCDHLGIFQRGLFLA